MRRDVHGHLSQVRGHDAVSMAFFQRELFRSLGNLARPAQEQIAYLQDIFRFMRMKQDDDWISADELALEYDEAFSGACGNPTEGNPGWWRRLGLTQTHVDALIRLDAKLLAMSGQENAELSTGLALKQSSHWQEVRDLALECLDLLESLRWRKG